MMTPTVALATTASRGSWPAARARSAWPARSCRLSTRSSVGDCPSPRQ
jgi:hypothetical protein